MYHFLRLILLLMLLSGLTSCGRNEKSSIQNVPPSPVELVEVGSAPHVFWNGCVTELPLKINNRSSSEVVITQFEKSCSCLEVSPPSLSISPGMTSTCILHVDYSSRIPGAEGTRANYQIIPRIEGSELSPNAWEIHGDVSYLLKLSSSQVRFRQPHNGKGELPVQIIDITSSIPLQSLEATGCDDLALLSVSQVTSTDYRLRVQLSDDVASSSEKHCTARLLAKLNDGAAVQYNGPLISAKIYTDYIASPDRTHLGFVNLDSEQKQVLLVRSLTGGEFNITSVKVESSHVGLGVEEHPVKTRVFDSSLGRAFVEVVFVLVQPDIEY